MEFQTVNKNSPVYASKSIKINAAPEIVWKVLVNVNNWTAWNNKISRATLEGEVTVGGRFSWKINGAAIESVFMVVDTARHLCWKGRTFGGSAVHDWRLEHRDGFTFVVVEESMEGWLVSLFKGKMNKALAADMQYWLEVLKNESEK